MSDWLEPELHYRKATPEEIRNSNRDPLVWFVIGVMVATFVLMILGYIDPGQLGISDD